MYIILFKIIYYLCLVETPLHICLKHRNEKIFNLLIQNKCDLTLKSKNNVCLLELIENDKDFKKYFDLLNIVIEKNPYNLN